MKAEDLTHALGGRWYGRYGMARCPAHEDREPSLSISNGENGRLLLKCHAGCEFADIRGRLPALADGSGPFPERASKINVPQRGAIQRLLEIIWSQALPRTGTLADNYLRSRSIIRALPDSLRFSSSLRHPGGEHTPAMVARIDKPDRDLTGLHRTYLDVASPVKTKLQPAKAMLGNCAGGAVRLRSGAVKLVVCEGIETGLSICDALEVGFAVWAALSTSGMTNLILPEPNRFSAALMIAMDGDDAGCRAGLRLADRATRLGWAVETISAPPGLDFNDLAQGRLHD
jgi:Toprim domain